MRLITLAASLAAAPAFAGQTYDCETKNFGRGGWVSDRIILAFDEEAKAGSAYDAFIHHIHKTPIPVKWRKRSESSYTFNWTVEGLESKNVGKSTVSYKVTLFADRRAFSLNGRLHGYDNVISASGTCKLVK